MQILKTYTKQKIAMGNDFENDIQNFLLPYLAGQKIVLVTGKRSFQSRQESTVLKSLIEATGGSIVSHLTCEENPKGKSLDKATSKLPVFDQLLAIGGGSVIDAAKKIKHSLGNNHQLNVIYTRFGSGSVVTPFFVYDNHEFKVGEHDKGVIPNRVYVSLELMAGLSVTQRCIGVSDILAHATESYLSTAGDKSHKTRALKIIETLTPDAPNWPLEQLVLLDIEAGLIESHCLVLLPHALGHHLTYTHHIPHGIASIITLPNFVRWLSIHDELNAEIVNHVTNLTESFLKVHKGQSSDLLRKKIQKELPEALRLIHKHMPFVFELSPKKISTQEIFQMLNTKNY
jgi:alcohol dehydrogenase class IV